MKKIFIITILILFVLFSTNSNSQDLPKNTLPTSNIIICLVSLEYWAEKDDVGYKGIYPQIFSRLMQSLSISNYQFVLAPYVRLQQLLDKGDCDMSITLADEQFDIQKGALVWQIDSVVILRDDLEANTIEEIDFLIIGLLRGAKVGFSFEQLKNIKKVETSNFYSLVKLLEIKRIDAIAGDNKIISGIAKSEGVKLGSIVKINDSPLPLTFIMSNKSPYSARFNLFNNALKKMVDSGETEKLILDAFINGNKKATK